MGWLVVSIANVVFAVSCHRILLLSPGSLPNTWGVYWTARELRFAGWWLAIILIIATGLATAVAVLVLLLAFSFGTEFLSTLDYRAILVLIGPPMAYLLARSSLVLPAAAVDDRLSLARAWSWSAGRGWKLTAILGAPFLPALALNALLNAIVGESSSEITTFARSLIFTLLGAFELSVLSIAYRSLARPQQPAVQPRRTNSRR